MAQGGTVTTLSPARVVSGPTEIPWLSAHLEDLKLEGCEAVTSHASFRAEPLVPVARVALIKARHG
jgi:hypothetical protein